MRLSRLVSGDVVWLDDALPTGRHWSRHLELERHQPRPHRRHPGTPGGLWPPGPISIISTRPPAPSLPMPVNRCLPTSTSTPPTPRVKSCCSGALVPTGTTAPTGAPPHQLGHRQHCQSPLHGPVARHRRLDTPRGPGQCCGTGGQALNGMAFTLYGGSAAWDYIGKH